MESKLVFVLPRLRIGSRQYNEDAVSLGKAVFLPDEDRTWNDHVKRPRPLCLDVFRQFPANGEDADVSRGTVVISEDPSWLRDNIPYIVAVAYVLGVRDNCWRPPAEAFQYYDLLVSEQTHDLAQFNTKTHRPIENVKTFHLLPPLELRCSQDTFVLDTTAPEFGELSNRLEAAQPDRLSVACYHLFRTQYDNGFIAPAKQDFAAYCASLEAAFDTPKSSDGGKTLAQRVKDFYERPELWDFTRGLYEERSIFNHGVSESNLPPHRVKLLDAFRNTRFNWDLLRHICCDVIIEQARTAAGVPRGGIGTVFSPVFEQLEKTFDSKEAWGELANRLTGTGSVKSLLETNKKEPKKLTGFLGLVHRFLLIHEWSPGDLALEANKACASLRCLAELIFATTDDEEVKTSVEALHKSSISKNHPSIGEWAAEHLAWATDTRCERLLDSACAASAHIAQLFTNK
jgi:hypothetical protein